MLGDFNIPLPDWSHHLTASLCVATPEAQRLTHGGRGAGGCSKTLLEECGTGSFMSLVLSASGGYCSPHTTPGFNTG